MFKSPNNLQQFRGVKKEGCVYLLMGVRIIKDLWSYRRLGKIELIKVELKHRVKDYDVLLELNSIFFQLRFELLL